MIDVFSWRSAFLLIHHLSGRKIMLFIIILYDTGDKNFDYMLNMNIRV